MESTARYWRSVWLELEPHAFAPGAGVLQPAPRGRKHDFKDAELLVQRLIADELILTFVPDGGTAYLAKPHPDERCSLRSDRVRL